MSEFNIQHNDCDLGSFEGPGPSVGEVLYIDDYTGAKTIDHEGPYRVVSREWRLIRGKRSNRSVVFVLATVAAAVGIGVFLWAMFLVAKVVTNA